ncbi:MAG: VPLPA-CTERM sorting domain-containing protein [Gammaproteobacteria bacterium]
MLNKNTLLALTATAAAAISAPAAFATLATYSQDFESLNAADPAALAGDNWKIFANVFDSSGTGFLYNYGVFDAPNGSGGFSNVATGEGGADQGAQQLVTFSDYNNTDHGVGNRIETNVFQEQIIDSSDAGSEWVFSFDAKMGDLAGDSTALAFIKTLDPGAGFATTNFVTIDMTTIASTWDTYTMSLFIDPALSGQILQFGFATTASGFDPSGILYDNVDFRPVPLPGAVWLMASGLLAFSRLRRKDG